MKRFLQITPTAASACEVARDFVETFMSQAVSCRYCESGVKTYPENFDIYLQDWAKPKHRLIMLNYGRWGILHEELLEKIRVPNLSQYLSLGKVYFGRDKKLMTPFYSFAGRHQILVRGPLVSKGKSTEANYSICSHCGRVRYFALHYSFLCPSPDPAIPAFTRGPSIVIPEEFGTGLFEKKLKGVGIEKLDVLDKPLDGYDELTGPVVDVSGITIHKGDKIIMLKEHEKSGVPKDRKGEVLGLLRIFPEPLYLVGFVDDYHEDVHVKMTMDYFQKVPENS